MSNRKNFLNEIKTLDDIEEVEREFEKKGLDVTNVSHWNPSLYFFDKILKPELGDHFFGLPDTHKYAYSYYLDETTKSLIRKGIGDETDNRECLITPSGTISIQCLLDFAKYRLKIHDIIVINPSYFSVHHSCRRLNINVQEIDMIRGHDNIFQINKSKLNSMLDSLKRKQANYGLWITNPIYSAGASYSQGDINYLLDLLEHHNRLHIFADESFAYSSCELLRDFSKMNRFFSIYDPWKQLCLNGLKFSVISYSQDYQKHFEEWADVIYGSLPSSSLLGISLYTSGTFSDYKKSVNQFYDDRLKELSERYGKKASFSFDTAIHGPYTSCYFSAKNFNLLSSSEKFRSLISYTGLSLIPNERNRYPVKCGFSFRVNLAKYDGSQFWENFDKLWEYINNL